MPMTYICSYACVWKQLRNIVVDLSSVSNTLGTVLIATIAT